MAKDDVKPSDATPDVIRLQAELAAKELELAKANEQLALLRAGDTGTSFRTTTTKPTMEFEVKPYRKDLTQLQPLKGQFVDESEAIRCFWRKNNGIKGINKDGRPMTLDSTNVNVECICHDLRREERIREQYKQKTREQLIPSLS